MAKIALILFAVFLCVQMTLCIREKRQADEPEATTAGTDWIAEIKSGFEKTISPGNIQKATDNLNALGDKVKTLATNLYEQGKKALEDLSATTAAPA